MQSFKGVIITGIQRNGPAAKAGMHADGTIAEIYGEAANDSKMILGLTARVKTGETLHLKILWCEKYWKKRPFQEKVYESTLALVIAVNSKYVSSASACSIDLHSIITRFFFTMLQMPMQKPAYGDTNDQQGKNE